MESGIPDKTLSRYTEQKTLPGRRRPVSIILSVFFALFFIAVLLVIKIILSSAAIYKGVLVQGTDVGGYTREELSQFLENQLSTVFDNLDITISSPSFERHISVSELGLKIDAASMVLAAYNVGRTGAVLDRLTRIMKLGSSPVSIQPIFDFNTKEFEGFLDKICSEVFQEVLPYNIIISEESIMLCTGSSGRKADRELLKTDIVKAVAALKPASIAVHTIEILPPAIDMDTTLKTINQAPVNARFVKTSRTTYEIVPHQTGRSIDRAKLLDIVRYVESKANREYEEILLPVEFTAPEVTEEILKDKLFSDTLSSYTTRFRTDTENNYNRSINIGLAAESIDGTLLLPGEEFSFNKIVGPRTQVKGYKTAHIFVEGQIRDGTGGGVCQVSTTLYNAVLRANLEVTERHNHMFTVGYVPLGQDAAVSYGYADLVFTNTTAHPLLINARVTNGNSLTFKISSTNDYPFLKVKLAHKTISTTPRTVQFIDDYSLPNGTAVVDENGMDGYIVDTYINVFNGDVLIREEKLHRSVYQMLPRKIRRGTAPTFETIE